VKFKPFENTDWWGYSGAERFPDGSDPIISEIASTDESVQVTFIVDGKGAEICRMTDDPETDAQRWILETTLFATQAEAIGWAEAVDWSPSILARFTRI
jgi:hypothetical protein